MFQTNWKRFELQRQAVAEHGRPVRGDLEAMRAAAKGCARALLERCKDTGASPEGMQTTLDCAAWRRDACRMMAATEQDARAAAATYAADLDACCRAAEKSGEYREVGLAMVRYVRAEAEYRSAEAAGDRR
jgi:hypothetical protein